MSASYRTFPLPPHPADSTPQAPTVYYSLVEEQSAEDFLFTAHNAQMKKKARRRRMVICGAIICGLITAIVAAGAGALMLWSSKLTSKQ